MSRTATNYVPARGDVVKLSLDPTRGHEQAGSRPVLILSPEEYNRRTGLALVCPITNQGKGYPFEIPIPDGLEVTGFILCDQIRCIDWGVRQARLFAALPPALVSEVTGRILPLIDPDEEYGPGEPPGG